MSSEIKNPEIKNIVVQQNMFDEVWQIHCNTLASLKLLDDNIRRAPLGFTGPLTPPALKERMQGLIDNLITIFSGIRDSWDNLDRIHLKDRDAFNALSQFFDITMRYELIDNKMKEASSSNP